jgi:hypothetical protein
MGVRDPEEAVRVILIIDNDVLGASQPLSITNNDGSNLIHSGIGKVIATPVRIWIKVKRYSKLLIRGHGDGQRKCLLIKVNGRMSLMKDALESIQDYRIKATVRVVCIMSSHTTFKSMLYVMNVQLGICDISALHRKN